MKKYFYLWMILTLITMSLISCKKNDSSTAKMQANVNNSLIVCDSTIYVKINGQNFYGVVGSQKGGNEFILSFLFSTGTYQFLSSYNGTLCEAFYWKNNFNNQYHSKNGSVTVTANSGRNVKGTFNFRGTKFPTTDSVEVVDGTFDIDY